MKQDNQGIIFRKPILKHFDCCDRSIGFMQFGAFHAAERYGHIMKITAFYPAIITREASGTLKNLEKLGFRVIHKRNDTVDDGDIEYVLEDAAGKRIDVVQSLTIDEDFYSIRVNVDDFDEAMKVYAEEGYTVFKGPFVLPDSKNVILTSPGKLQVMLMQHIEDKNVLSEDELDQVTGGTYQIKLYDNEKTKVKNTLKSNIQIF